MIAVKNRQEIIDNGETSRIRECRTIALDCIEHTINAVEPKQLLKNNVKVEDGCLKIEDYSFSLSEFKHIYVVGGGKASGLMAQALEDIIGDYLTAGEVNVPHGLIQKTRIIKLNEAGHPVPDDGSVKGTLRIMALAEQAEKEELVINVISGGGSSLMAFPLEGITLADQQAITGLLLKSGAAITEVNIVRKHLSAFKGGRLAKKAYPATIVNLILSDVLGDPLDSIASGPTVPDPSTFLQAKAVLEKYDIWSSAPLSVQNVLSSGAAGQIEETPKEDNAAFRRVYSKVIGNNRVATLAAVKCLNLKRLNTLLMAENLVGEAKDVGRSLANLAGELYDSSIISKPLAVILGGETTVTVKGKGVGGRNQELALAAALNLRANKECVIASFSTDGVDGPTNGAGAIVDNYTLKAAKAAGLDPNKELENNNSNPFFAQLGDLVITGATGTNVNDLTVIVCPKQ